MPTIPSPPVKRKKLLVSSVMTDTWLCTDETDNMSTNGAKVYTWDGTSECFGGLTEGTYHMCDSDGENHETFEVDSLRCIIVQ
jgi:hypothetical protein